MQKLFILTLIKKNLIPIIGIFIYGLVGIVLIFIGLYIFERVVGCNVKEELSDRNFSVGISVAALILGTAIIVSSAIKGRSSVKNTHNHSNGEEAGCGTPPPPTQQNIPAPQANK